MPSLRPQHAQYLTDRSGDMMVWLKRVERRLAKHGFCPNDPIMREVIAAHIAMHDLRITTMYAAIDGHRNEWRDKLSTCPTPQIPSPEQS